MDLRPGEAAVDVGGLRLEVSGFAGEAEVVTAAAERGAPTRDALTPGSVADRLAAHLASVPGSPFDVGAPVEVRGAPESHRDGAAGATTAAQVDAVPGHVPLLLVEDGDGTLQWVLPDNHDELVTPATSVPTGERGAAPAVQRDGAPPVARFTVPMGAPAPAAEPGERGLVSIAFKKVFRVVSAALFDPLVEAAGENVARWAERSRRPRLRRFTPDDYTSADAPTVEPPELTDLAGGPVLLLLHGTNLQSHSAFGRLPKWFVEQLWAGYGGRVLAYDHPTLSRSPAENARWLTDRVPTDRPLTVDVLAHGRGGLVARELAERPPATGVQVRSISFVGTPNAGTPLCEPAHLVSYVDLLTNALSLVPDNGVTDALDGIVSVLSHVARKAFEGIPGTIAMDPTGEYLRELNAAGAPPDGCTYRAIAAEYEPDADAGWKRKIRDAVIDRVFRGEANDLVVPTESVWGGELVPAGARVRRDGDALVDHESYWDDRTTLDTLRAWLVTPEPASGAPPDPGAGPQPAPGPQPAQGPQPAAGTRPETAVPGPLPRPASPPAPEAAVPNRDIGEPDAGPPPTGSRPTVDTPTLVVEVVHGSLEHARYPVVVGHGTGAMLEGAEGYVDGRFGGALSRRQFLRLYPDSPGAVLEVEPAADPRPPGAIVVGLGLAQDLTVATLVHAATQATLARLASITDARLAERRDMGDAKPGIGLSCVLLGTAPPSGISVPAAAAALVEGVLRANKLVQGQPAAAAGGEPPAVTHLEIIELQQDRAEIAARSLLRREPVLARLVSGGEVGGPRVRCEREVRQGEGGRPASRPDDQRSTAWRTLSVCRTPIKLERSSDRPPVEDPAIAGLEYRLMGDVAGVANLTHPVDDGLIGPLLARATRRYEPDDQVHNTLFELLLPTEVKTDLASGGNVQLVVDPAVADYPWEMLAARRDDGTARPLCVEGGLLRQLDLGSRWRPRLRRPSGNNALVIGNPPAGPSFPALRGATEEAIAVADLLAQRDYTVTRLIFDMQGRPIPPPPGEPDPFKNGANDRDRYWQIILDELYRREYRIAHLAMHGTFDAEHPSRSGAVIGPDRYLSAPVFRSLRAVPDFVFFNCCHLGRVDDAEHASDDVRLVAASVATELMTGGVRAVVAAGWAVHDLDAVTFATTLYESLLDGVPYGDATREARTLVYAGPTGDITNPDPRSSTWGAYQCYGEPGFRLALIGRRPQGRESADLLLRSDVARRLGELAAEAGDVRSLDDRHVVRARLKERLATVEAYIEERAAADKAWPTPMVWVALADAQTAVGDFEGAIQSLEHAVHGRSSDYPIAAVEKLANLEVRQAQKLVRLDEHEMDTRRLFTQAHEVLTPLLAIERTAERLALLGSYWKKRAASLYGARCEGDTQPEQEKDLVAARDTYREAAAKSKKPYHVLIDVQLSHLLGAADVDAALERIDRAFDAGGPDEGVAEAEFVAYWDRIAEADRLLTMLLLRGQLDAEITTLERTYVGIFAERSTWRERDSTVDHLWDLSRLHHDATEAAALNDLWSRLRTAWQGDT
jgi:hypothetical protein